MISVNDDRPRIDEFLNESATPRANENGNEEDTIGGHADCMFRSIDSVHLRGRSHFMNINDHRFSRGPAPAIIVSPLITSRVRYLRDSIVPTRARKKKRARRDAHNGHK